MHVRSPILVNGLEERFVQEKIRCFKGVAYLLKEINKSIIILCRGIMEIFRPLIKISR